MRVALEILKPIVENLRRPLETLTRENVTYLEAHPATPPLYESGVVYREEGLKLCGEGRVFKRQLVEDWNAIPTVLQKGHADCEDLCAYRAAELRLDGAPEAFAFPLKAGSKYHPQLGRINLIHVLVARDARCRPDDCEDPSAVLGMTPVPWPILKEAIRRYCRKPS